MFWLIGIGCLALGVIIGALSANRLSGTPTRIKELEGQVKSLEERHDQYKDDVSDHFNVTADLVQQMTQSYRDVYQHLATGAQDLCTSEVANKLLPAGADAVFDTAGSGSSALGFNPPKDYATKQSPDQKGALAEDFGIEKTSVEEDEPVLSEELEDSESSQQEEQDSQGDNQEVSDSDSDEAESEKTAAENLAPADDDEDAEAASEEEISGSESEEEEENPKVAGADQEVPGEEVLELETESQTDEDEEDDEKDDDAGDEDEDEDEDKKNRAN
ncbi:MAG: DUF1043 family protein [Gammaproteobacteria bacterium]|jgi:hypothetical protein